MIDHVCLAVSDLQRSARFYDALFFPLGGRRLAELPDAIAYGIAHEAVWVRQAREPSASGAGHVALSARGKAAVDAAHAAGLRAGGRDDGSPGPRPDLGRRCYAGCLRDPDGLRVELVSGSR